jgi:hypothetical protein
VTPPGDAVEFGRCLRDRLRSTEAVAQRYASFAFDPDDVPVGPPVEDREVAAARDLLLRVARTVADPLNYRLLVRLREGDADLTALADLIDLPHLALWDRVSDLMQAGLVGRSLPDHRAGLTRAGEILVDTMEAAASAATGTPLGQAAS